MGDKSLPPKLAQARMEMVNALRSSAVCDEILLERMRQIRDKGFTPEHDDHQHGNGQIQAAAAAYLEFSATPKRLPSYWPWDPKWWKPSDRRRNLVKAAALIVAEIERLDRAKE